MTIEEKIEYWVDSGQYDFKTARSMQRSGRYVYTVFMCQQSIEKYLKALHLKKREVEAPRSHNLPFLLGRVAIEVPQDDRQFLAELSSFYISGRYPTYKMKVSAIITRKKAKEYLRKSSEFLKWIKKILAE